jgi:hypothetical protein
MTDADVPLDPTDLGPDVTPTDESAADKAIRQGDEGGVGPYVVQPGRLMERNGIVLEAGTQVWFGSTAEATSYVSSGTVA